MVRRPKEAEKEQRGGKVSIPPQAVPGTPADHASSCVYARVYVEFVHF